MTLSFIIPTLNEATLLPQVLRSIPKDAEVIVSDGGSSDDTTSVARKLGAAVISGSPGRGVQLNRGTRAAAGDILVFVHADCVLEANASDAIATALADHRVVGGSFRLWVESTRWSIHLITGGANLRARYLGIPYGDQGLFVRREAFESAGGYPELPLMEDVALVRALKRKGRLVQTKTRIKTAPRHWKHLGALFTTALNWTTMSLYLLGIPAETLAPTYHRLHGNRRTVTTEKPTVLNTRDTSLPSQPRE